MVETMDGRRCIVTGATSGIGLAAAVQLARRGARLVLIGRDAERTSLARRALEAVRPACVESFHAVDFRELDRVAGLAAALGETGPVDVLINNAGVLKRGPTFSPSGWELHALVNHLSVHVFTLGLLPALVSAPSARIVNVSSRSHARAMLSRTPMTLKMTAWREGAVGRTGAWLYGHSKLSNLLWSYALARRLRSTPVTCNAVHPGVVATGLRRDFGPLAAFAYRRLAMSSEQGAAALVHLSSDSGVGDISGAYFDKTEPAQSSAESLDLGTQEQLWTATTKATSVDPTL